MCVRWRSFIPFLQDVGPCPVKDGTWSLHRLDNSKSYEPGNVQWMSVVEHSKLHAAQRSKTKRGDR
jgi:hypothetical protein